MAQRITLHYIPTGSPLHLWDARCKLGALVISSLLLWTNDIHLLTAFSLGIIVIFVIGRLPLRLLTAMRYWLIFLLIIFGVQAVSFSGDHFASLPWLPLNPNTAVQAALICWRLALMLLLSVIFTATTRPQELKQALLRLLRPVPFIRERRVAVMVSLTMRFFTMILDLSADIQAAGRARLADHNRNPIKRIKFLVLPLLRRIFTQADNVAFALAARGYREDLPVEPRHPDARHWVPFGIYIAVLSLYLLLR